MLWIFNYCLWVKWFWFKREVMWCGEEVRRGEWWCFGKIGWIGKWKDGNVKFCERNFKIVELDERCLYFIC